MSTLNAAPRRTRKGDGQWALGYREPLNANEQMKKDDDALNVRARIENIYSKRGFDSIDPGDMRGRFRWWGLYTQRREGIDGGKTGSLTDAELEDSYFMLRVRIDGGQLNLQQLRTIGELSTKYGRGTADLTDRQNVQYHWIDIVDVPSIWNRLEEVGLSTQEACGDCPRVILGSPVAGISTEEFLDPTPAIETIKDRYIGDPSFSNLPRKYKTAISGHPGHDVVPQINDVAFVGAVHPEHGPGFDVWVGGGLSTNPILAQRLGVWVSLEEVADVWVGVTSIFRDYGYRRLRNRARLKFLVADWGVEKFREVLETEYLNHTLTDLDDPGAPATPADHVGIHQQKDGRWFVGVAPAVGRLSGELLLKIADIVEAHGSDRIRTTPMQKLLILDIEEDKIESLVSALDEIGLHARPNEWRRNTMACTGIEFCKLAIVDTKNRATELADELDVRFPSIDTPITINVNGCPNSCARVQTGDIGLKGQLVLDEAGNQVEGFQVHLGGSLGLNPGFGRKLRGHKVTTAQLPDYVSGLAENYLAQRTNDEAFADWVARADEADLR